MVYNEYYFLFMVSWYLLVKYSNYFPILYLITTVTTKTQSDDEKEKNDEIYLCAEKYFLSNLSTTHHGIKTPFAIFSVHDDGNGIADYFAAKL